MSEFTTLNPEQPAAPQPAKRKKGGQPGNQNARVPQDQTPKKKRGAPYGNQNARTFGFYSRKLPVAQLDGLEDTTIRSVEDEIELMRVFSRKVAELGAEVNELDEAKSVLNTLSNATGSINRLVRTHAYIPTLGLDPPPSSVKPLKVSYWRWPEYRTFTNQWCTPGDRRTGRKGFRLHGSPFRAPG